MDGFRDFEMVGALYIGTTIADKENSRFQMKYFYQYFQILSILTIIIKLDDEILSVFQILQILFGVILEIFRMQG